MLQVTKQYSITFAACLAIGLSLSPSKLAWAEPDSPLNALPNLALSEAQSGQALESYMEYMVDPSGMATLLELFSPSYENAFTPLEHGIPLADTGSTWLRLSITPDSDNSHAIALDSALATDITLYIPDIAEYIKNKTDITTGTSAENNTANSTKACVATPWQEIFIPHGEAITLPPVTDANLLEQIQNVSVPIYIHMAGTPEPWFAPQLRSITDIANDNSRLIHIGITMMLIAVLALCLLRAVTEKGQWRLWTTFFTAALLVESLAGLPSTPHGSIGLAGLPSVLAPTIALMILPHIARHMLRRTELSHKHTSAPNSFLDNDLDRQYRFLSIPCMLVAIVPLLPNLGWLGKLLPLWPLAIILFLPTTIIALFRNISGAKLFLAACLVGISGALCALVAMLIGMPATIINAIPLCGTALCSLCLVGIHGGQKQTTAQCSPKDEQPEKKSSISILEDYADPLTGEGLRLVPAEEGLATGIVLNGEVVPDGKFVENDATATASTIEPRRISSALGKVREIETVTPKNEQKSDDENTSEPNNDAHVDIVPDHVDTEQAPDMAEEPNNEMNSQTTLPVTVLETPSQSLASNLRGPLEQDDVHSLVRAEEAMRYPLETLRKSMEALQKCALNPDTKALCQDAANASKQLNLVGEEFRRATYRLPAESASMIFDLQSCLREAHDNVCERSDAKNIALSWFMAPHLVQTYQGDEDRLRTTLRVLMESAVDATDKGSVYLSARRVPDSTNPGHLLFTITDTGAGGPPERRKASALMLAWELATSTGGSLSIDSGVHGTTISFSTRFLAIHNENTPTNPIQHRINGYNGLANSMSPKSGKQACIVIAAPAASNRQLLAFYLEDTAYYAEEAVSTLDIMAKYTSHGAELIILDGDMNEAESSKVIATARQYEAENDLPPVPFLALVRDEAQADAFLQRGCTQTLLKPVTRSGLCAQVALLAPIVLMPKMIDEVQNDENPHAAEPSIAQSQQNIIAPELINTALTEAMELLTEPAPLTSPTTEYPENIQGDTSESSQELAIPAQESTQEPEQESTPEPISVPEPEIQTPAQSETQAQAVPTSEAEDITLRLFEEHLQNEKSSVSPSMLDLDPILFTDIMPEPSAKAKKRKNESTTTIKIHDETDRDESVSAVRIVTSKNPEPLAKEASAQEPEAQESKDALSDVPILENPNQFIYNNTESEVSKPRPMHRDVNQDDIAPIAMSTPQPEPSPTPYDNAVYVEAVTVGTETLRLYKDPTKSINPDDEYAAMLAREAQQCEHQDTVQAQQTTILWCPASEIAESIEPIQVAKPALLAEPVTEPEPVAHVQTIEPEPVFVTEPVTEPEPVLIMEPTPPIEPAQVTEPASLERKQPIEPILVVEPVETSQAVAPEKEIAPEIPTIEAPSFTEPKAEEVESEESTSDKPNAVTRVTSTLYNVYHKLCEPAPLNIMDKTLPSLHKIREAFEAAGFPQDQSSVQEVQSELNNDEPSYEEQLPRFVSIAQSVSEIAATIKPTPSIARNSSHKNFVPQLIVELENAMAEAMTGYEQDDIVTMQDAAARVADTAEALGLRRLERSTRCVERAAAAGDLGAARELYADMEQTIQHTLTALRSAGLDGAHRI